MHEMRLSDTLWKDAGYSEPASICKFKAVICYE